MENHNPIELPVKEWQHALQGLGKVVRRKSSLPVLQYLKIRRTTDGQVTVAGTDLESFAIYQAKSVQMGPETEFLAPMEAVSNAAKASEGRLGLAYENGQVKILTRLAGQPIEQPVESPAVKEWPEVPQFAAAGCQVKGEFLATLQQALQCAGSESARAVLCGAYLDTSDPQAHYLVASGGRVMFAANSLVFALPASVIIPNRKFLNWKELADGAVEISVQPLAQEPETAAWVRVQTRTWEFITQGIEGPFPNWRQAIPTANFQAQLKLSVTALNTVLQVAPKLPGNTDVNQPVVLAVQEGGFYLAAQSGPTAIPITWTEIQGGPVRVALDRRHLLQAMRFGLNEIRIVDELSPVVFANTTGKRLIVSAIRLL